MIITISIPIIMIIIIIIAALSATQRANDVHDLAAAWRGDLRPMSVPG